jgi:hypothetical protein
MSKTVTLRLRDNIYSLFYSCAESDNRSLSNFIETCALQHLKEHEYVDDFEMAEINSNKPLQKSLRRGYSDAKARKGRLVR